jgi:hypothetical protein
MRGSLSGGRSLFLQAARDRLTRSSRSPFSVAVRIVTEKATVSLKAKAAAN